MINNNINNIFLINIRSYIIPIPINNNTFKLHTFFYYNNRNNIYFTKILNTILKLVYGHFYMINLI